MHLTFILGFALSSLVISAQNFSIEYFEVYTKLAHKQNTGGFSIHPDSIAARINRIPDTALTYATFAVAVINPSIVDSLYFSLKNSNNEQVYTHSTSVAGLTTDSGFRLSGKTFYWTVGPYPYLKRFTAQVQYRANGGQLSELKEFQKQ